MAASKGFLIIVLFALSAEFIASQDDDTYDGLFANEETTTDDVDLCEIFETCDSTSPAARATSTTPRATTTPTTPQATTTRVWRTTTTAPTTRKRTTVPTPTRTVSEDDDWQSPEVTAL